jgi:hypothetical protein
MLLLSPSIESDSAPKQQRLPPQAQLATRHGSCHRLQRSRRPSLVHPARVGRDGSDGLDSRRRSEQGYVCLP